MMKKSIISALFILISANSMADTGNNYAFAQLGAGATVSGLLDDFFNTYSLHNGSGVAARAGVGHAFNRYFSIESGMSLYPSAIRVDDPKHSIFPTNVPASTSRISDLASVDVMAKASLPIKSVKFYVMGGASATHAKYDAPNNTSQYTFNWSPGSKNFVTPKFGVGLNVPLNDKVNLDIMTLGSPSIGDLGKRDYLPHLQSATIGLQWNG